MRVRRSGDAEDEQRWPHANAIAVLELDRTIDQGVIHPGAVAAAEIFDDRFLGRHHDARVPARGLRRRNGDHAVERAADEILAVGERNQLTAPPDRVASDGERRPLVFHGRGRLREGVAEAMDRTNDRLRIVMVIKRRANLADQPRERRSAVRRVAPHRPPQLLVRHRIRTPHHEHLEQPERFRGKWHRPFAAGERTRAHVEEEITKAETQRGSRFGNEFGTIRKRLPVRSLLRSRRIVTPTN